MAAGQLHRKLARRKHERNLTATTRIAYFLLFLLAALAWFRPWRTVKDTPSLLQPTNSIKDYLTSRTPDRATAFIYVYKLPERYHSRIRRQHALWHDVQYDAEKAIHEWLLNDSRGQSFRTDDPEKASLFFLPIYTSYFINVVCGRDHQTKIEEAVRQTSALVGEAIEWVRTSFPFWNRSGGADHFITATYDHGRCNVLTFLPEEVVGGLFTLQMNGDTCVRSVDTVGNNSLRVLAFNGEGRRKLRTPAPSWRDIACYHGGHDVVIPPVQLESLHDPRRRERPISLLGSFGSSVRTNDGVDSPIFHHGHAVRAELWDIFERRRPRGWEFGLRIDLDTHRDMRRSKFCACPPGNSQWTSRVVKSLLLGCIPVTFFCQHDSPWQEDIDYSSFTINIDPGEVKNIVMILENIQANRTKIHAIYDAMQKVQPLFSYNPRLGDGALVKLMEVLAVVAEKKRTRTIVR